MIRVWIIVNLVLLALSGCGSPKKKAVAEQTKTPPPSPAPVVLTTQNEFLHNHCGLLKNIVIDVSRRHLVADEAQVPMFLTKGTNEWLAFIEKKFELTPIDFTEKDFCTVFSLTMQRAFEKRRQEVPPPEGLERFVHWESNHLLDFILNQMDYFTSIDYNSVGNDYGFTYTRLELPVLFVERSDYRWRKPPHLVVHPFYKGSLASMFPKETKVSQIEEYAISENSYYKTKEFLRYAIPKEKVSVSVQYPNTASPKTITVPSKKTDPEENPVISHIVSPGVLYVRIKVISEKSKDKILSHINHALQGIEDPQGLILDVRGNPGGLGHYAEKISSFFLPPETPIHQTKQIRYDNEQKQKIAIFQVYKNDFEPDVVMPAWNTFKKILILTDRTSASSSEIITAALTLNGAAISLGEKTFGKSIGTITKTYAPEILPISITTDISFAHPSPLFTKYMPEVENGWFSWQAKGLVPMIEVKDPVMDDMQSNEKAKEWDNAFSMKDFKRFGHNIIDALAIEEPIEVEFSEELMEQDRFRHLDQLRQFVAKTSIASCQANATPFHQKASFDESKECIFEMGLAVMQHWITLR